MPSSVIASYAFNPEKSELTVEFLSGLVYVYIGVPESVYLEFKSARSKGSFLNQRIKGVYNFRRLPPC